jgi:hypothetical protein
MIVTRFRGFIVAEPWWLVLGSGGLLLLNCDDWHSVQGIYCCWTVIIVTRFRGFIVAESWWLVLGSGGFIVAELWWLVLGSGELLLLNPDDWHSVQGIYCCWILMIGSGFGGGSCCWTVMIGTQFRGFIVAEPSWLVLRSGDLFLPFIQMATSISGARQRKYK